MALFNNAAAPATDAKKERQPREMLQDRDTIAAVLLNPSGRAALSKASLPELFQAMADKDKYVAYHSEFACADETQDGDYRRGIGLSKMAAALDEAVKNLRDEKFAGYLDKKKLQSALQEAQAELLPHVLVLNVGKNFLKGSKGSGVQALKKRRADCSSVPPTNEAIDAAAKGLFAWLKKGDSVLRDMIEVLGADGSMYVANAAEKCARLDSRERR